MAIFVLAINMHLSSCFGHLIMLTNIITNISKYKSIDTHRQSFGYISNQDWYLLTAKKQIEGKTYTKSNTYTKMVHKHTNFINLSVNVHTKTVHISSSCRRKHLSRSIGANYSRAQPKRTYIKCHAMPVEYIMFALMRWFGLWALCWTRLTTTTTMCAHSYSAYIWLTHLSISVPLRIYMNHSHKYICLRYLVYYKLENSFMWISLL